MKPKNLQSVKFKKSEIKDKVLIVYGNGHDEIIDVKVAGLSNYTKMKICPKRIITFSSNKIVYQISNVIFWQKNHFVVEIDFYTKTKNSMDYLKKLLKHPSIKQTKQHLTKT